MQGTQKGYRRHFKETKVFFCNLERKQLMVGCVEGSRGRAGGTVGSHCTAGSRGMAGSHGIVGMWTQWQTGSWIWKLKEKNMYLEILQEEEFVFSLSARDLSISSIHLLVFSIFFSPTSENHVKLLPPNTYKKALVLLFEVDPRNSSRALHRGIERDYFMSS